MKISAILASKQNGWIQARIQILGESWKLTHIFIELTLRLIKSGADQPNANRIGLPHSPPYPRRSWAVSGAQTAGQSHRRGLPARASVQKWADGRVGALPQGIRSVRCGLPAGQPDKIFGRLGVQTCKYAVVFAGSANPDRMRAEVQ